MSKSTGEDAMYDALAGALAALKVLHAALKAENGTTPKPLTVVKGQGRGSKKPPAELKSVGQ